MHAHGYTIIDTIGKNARSVGITSQSVEVFNDTIINYTRTYVFEQKL